MTIIDYLLLAALLALSLYVSGRLFLGWLRGPSYEGSETSNLPNSSPVEPQAGED